jgi:lysophospholipase L1-like esterase
MSLGKAESDARSLVRHARARSALASALLLLVSTIFSLAAGEAVLRLKNRSMDNYDIEMWRYARELKQRSDDPLLGHEHVPSRSGVLQSVEIRINEHGLRGASVPPPVPARRRILVLGSSVTLGWGVAEEDTLTEVLRRDFAAEGKSVEVLNAGIGNYNAPRYVRRFLTQLADLQPTDILVDYFLRDAETLDAGGGNLLLRNSELAAMLWITLSRYFGAGSEDLVHHYARIYQPDAPGYRDMVAALRQLADYAADHNIRLYLAMTPDVHDLVHYDFAAIHEQMRVLATAIGYRYVDLLPAMRNLTPQELWSMPGDPHPNALGHRLMAEAIFPVLDGRP